MFVCSLSLGAGVGRCCGRATCRRHGVALFYLGLS